MEENKFTPLSEQEYNDLKGHLAGITHTLPTHLAGIFWAWCNRVRGVNTAQPCTCQSSAKLWGSCVEELQKYVKRVDGQA